MLLEFGRTMQEYRIPLAKLYPGTWRGRDPVQRVTESVCVSRLFDLERVGAIRRRGFSKNLVAGKWGEFRAL